MTRYNTNKHKVARLCPRQARRSPTWCHEPIFFQKSLRNWKYQYVIIHLFSAASTSATCLARSFSAASTTLLLINSAVALFVNSRICDCGIEPGAGSVPGRSCPVLLEKWNKTDTSGFKVRKPKECFHFFYLMCPIQRQPSRTNYPVDPHEWVTWPEGVVWLLGSTNLWRAASRVQNQGPDIQISK